jgi:hypothetical protein
VARLLADRAWRQASALKAERDLVRAARVQGVATLGLGLCAEAEERLSYALTRARSVNLVEEELPALIGLAELCRGRQETSTARALLDDVWEPVERGPYPLFHVDALNVLSQLERDAGNRPAAVEAATRAYRLAWCDGPPYAYHWGLEAARAQLAALAAPAPSDLPPHDESRHEPVPYVVIDP